MGPRVRGPAAAVAAAALLLGVLAVAGCSSAAGAPTKASASAAAGSAVHLTAYSDNDGPTEAVVLTGAIGDYGQAVSVHPDGSVDPDHSGQLSLRLGHGAFRLDIAAMDRAFVAAMAERFPTNRTTCSGSVAVTERVPVVSGSGTGAYRNVSGSFTLTLTLDEVDRAGAGRPCDGSSAFLGQAIVITGPGSVTFPPRA
ncbi:hypothetical protein [Streptacidiphilus rugosus]|uniref:hypothetical protein n=1 Tax=Streptacidiphilus rugosus TaxID=405783 RepID=UPI00056B8108|nr:hypothetical protein [Streptacidiphilus rugosus]